MTGNPIGRTDSPSRVAREADPPLGRQRGLFSELTQVESLRAAYSKLQEVLPAGFPADRGDPPLDGAEVSGLLQQLGEDLRAGAFPSEEQQTRPGADENSHGCGRAGLRGRILQTALSTALESIFPADPPTNPVAWTTAIIGQGLARVSAVTIKESEADRREYVLAAVRQRVDDPAFLALLGNVLKGVHFPDAAGPNSLASVVTRIALKGVDEVLHQANVLGREGSYVHAACARFGHDVALFLDNDTRYDWLLPAVQKRLREALAEIRAEIDPEKTRSADLARGERLHFLDHEFRLVKDRDGTARVQCKSLPKASPPEPEPPRPSRRGWSLPALRRPRRTPPRKPAAPAGGPSGGRFHWPVIDLRWPNGSWSWSLNLPRRAYAVAAGVLIGAAVLAVAAAVAPLLRGQGPRLYPVRGQVFYEGRPAAGALVVFLPKDSARPEARMASAVVAEDGSYVLGTHEVKDGALTGAYVVTICMTRNYRQVNLPEVSSLRLALPARYASRHTSPLTVTVPAGPIEVPAFHLENP